MSKKIAMQVRLDECFHAKAKIIAEKELRSLNSQLEYFVMKGVEQYEKENGEIHPFAGIDINSSTL